MVCIQNNQKFHKLYYTFNICIIGNDNDDNNDNVGNDDDMEMLQAHTVLYANKL